MKKFKLLALMLTGCFLFGESMGKERPQHLENANGTFCASRPVKGKRNGRISTNASLDGENEATESNDEMVSPTSIGVVGSVSGTLTWQDDEGIVRPLVGVKVKATISGSWWSSEQYTDENGYYKISYNDIWYIGSGKPSIHIYSEAESVCVKNASGSLYSFDYEFNGSSGDWTKSYEFSPKTDKETSTKTREAMMILQGAKAFADYARTLNSNNNLDMCTFFYPIQEVEGVYTHYETSGSVYLTVPEQETSPKTYAAWDVIGHEYGHHVQKAFGLLSNYWGDHLVDRNLIDEYTKGNDYIVTEEIKRKGLHIAWNEAWPTYWSTLAQTHFSDSLKKIKTVGDTRYTSSPEIDYDLNEYKPSVSQGEADECAIQKILYKLYSSQTDEWDRFSLGEDKIWEIIKANKPKTFYEFMQAMYNNGYDKNELGILLRQYNVIGGGMSISHNYLDGTPTLTWSAESGSDALRMNEFDLYFTDTGGNIIDKIYNVKGNGSISVSKELSSSTWSNIYKADGDSFNVYFVARQVDFFETGNYYSELFAFPKPASFSDTKIQIKPNEWGFIGRYYYQDEIEEDESVRYSTLEKGGMAISTDRLRCGYIRKSYLVLSPRKEGAGEAYFEMTFGQAVYSVQWGLCLWGDDEMLDGHVGIEARYVGGGWSEIADLTEDLKYLPLRGEGIHRSFYYFPSGCSGIRVTAKASAEGSSNKGRLCMDDFVLGISANQKDNTDYGIPSYPKTEA